MASQNKNFWQLLAEWIQSLLPSFSLGSSSSDTSSDQGGTASSAGSVAGTASGSTPPDTSGRTGLNRVVQGGHITARFLDTDSPAWTHQFEGTPMQGRHGGLDISAPQGTPVYAPYSMNVVAIRHYDDRDRNGDPCCRYGHYIIGYLDADPTLEYYSGHLQNVRLSGNGHVDAGQQIGETNMFAHTHIQMKRGGVLVNPETYFNDH